jgi:hypothetical protein
VPFKIQRVPTGLLELLSISGGGTPIDLEERVRGGLDFLQLYGASQLQSGFANNAALAEGGNGVVLTLNATRWTVLFAAGAAVQKTATATALRASINLNRRTQFGTVIASEELGPFGATETGTCTFGALLPYPLVCPPGTTIAVILNVLGTDATANVSAFAEFGVIG